MIQYTDNTFSQPMPVEDIFNQSFYQILPKVKAIHFGTPEELAEVKTTEQRLDVIENEVKEMNPVKTSLIIPTNEEVKQFS